MQKKAVLALLLAVIMMVTCSCTLIEKDEEVDRATVIIKVGDRTHTKGEIQDQVDYQLQYMNYIYSMYGYTYDVTDADNIADAQDSVINSLIEQDVKEMKAAELGITLTEEEDAAAVAEADEAWDSYVSSYKSYYFADSTLEGDELTAAIEARMAEDGYDKAEMEEEYREDSLLDKLQQVTVADVTVTDEELQTELDSKAESAKTTYESNLSSYGTSFNNGSTVYYRPAGYRLVKQILIKYTDDDQTQLDAINTALTTAQSNVTSLTSQLSDIADLDTALAAVSVTVDQPTDIATPSDLIAATTYTTDATFGEEITEEQADLLKQLASANKEVEVLTQMKADVTAEALSHLDAEADDIIAQLNAGADWDTLMAEKTQDPGMQAGAATAETGYAVCENMTGMDEPFVTASMALANVGDVSPKTVGAYGYYIIKYVGDVQEGAVSLDEVRDTLYSSVLSTKQTEYYDEQVSAWVSAANATIDTKSLNN